jgi:signal transduction histidine kinase
MTTIQASWLVLAVMAATSAFALGVPLWFSATAFACAILPPLAGMFMRGSMEPRRIVEIESGLWIALATAAAASTGAGTAAAALFAVAIGVAWRFGDERLTIEIGAFALLGVVLMLIVSTGGVWLHPHDATIVATAYGMAGLVQVGILAVTAVAERRPLAVAPPKPVEASNPDPETALRLKQAESRLKQASMAAEEARIDAATARERLEARTTFFAQTSHELRTPLNAIVGFAEMMRNEVYGPLPERYQEYAGLIHEGGRNLTLVVDDVLDLARIESGKFDILPELLSLTDHADDAVRFMSAEADRRNIALESTGPDDVEALADAKAVRQIALNLISNALKFTPSGGRVEVAAMEVPGGAVLTVSDTGEGISPKDLEDLSKAFVQGEAGKRHKGGAGLGLSVVRAFADLHGGRLDIESRIGGGTTISVFFPEAGGNGSGGNGRITADEGTGKPRGHDQGT